MATIDPTDKKVEATATKEFFISMLIKDITLRDAIGDLVDNCVDGAKRHAKSTENLKDFWIKITAKEDKFEIEDNCGGIDVEVAQEYAFRFGRPEKHKLSPYSIGQFGIGMKRAFFKIGNYITVTSTALKSSFKLIIDVNTWRKDEANWNFQLDEKHIKNTALNKCGTKIVVTSLSDDSKANFDSKTSFFSTLVSEIEREHLYSLNKGLKITINNKPLLPPNITLISNDKFKPGYWSHKFDGDLKVDVYAGISEDKGLDGGWYIFCNERLITGPDTSADTGWTGKGKDGVAEYHDQFHRFRGYVFFQAKQASNLPWNTTKTGMNLDSPEYQYVREQMINMMRPVMTLMNQLKKEKEKDTPEAEQPLNNMLKKAAPVQLSKVVTMKKELKEVFQFPKEKPKTQKSGEGKISYTRPYAKIDKVKNYFGITKLGDVGEYTFDYFYKNEIE